MKTIRQLQAEHGRILELIDELLKHISGHPPIDMELIVRLRREFSRTVMAHLGAEDWIVYPKLLVSDKPAVVRLAREFVDELGGMAELIQAHAARWTRDRIEEDWAGFCGETSGIVRRLRDRIKRENDVLYPMAARERALRPDS